MQLQSLTYTLCHQADETQEHLFFDCQFAKELWAQFQRYWGIKIQMQGMRQSINSLTKL